MHARGASSPVSAELRKRAGRLDALARRVQDGTATAADVVAELLDPSPSGAMQPLPQSNEADLLRSCAETADSLRRLADALERQQVPAAHAAGVSDKPAVPQLTPTEIRIINYARLASVALQSRIAVLATWLLPTFALLCGWLVLFRPLPTDGPLIQLRNCVASLGGLPLFAGAALGLFHPAGVTTYVVAILTWLILIAFAMFTGARRMPLWAHFGLSIFWTLGGLLGWLNLSA